MTLQRRTCAWRTPGATQLLPRGNDPRPGLNLESNTFSMKEILKLWRASSAWQTPGASMLLPLANDQRLTVKP